MPIPTRFKVRAMVEPPVPDAPGYNLKPDPAEITSVEELADALDRLRLWAGNPSLRELSRRCVGGRPSRVTFGTVVKGERLPPLDVVLVFVTALGLHADLEVWAEAWRRLALDREAGREGAGVRLGEEAAYWKAVDDLTEPPAAERPTPPWRSS